MKVSVGNDRRPFVGAPVAGAGKRGQTATESKNCEMMLQCSRNCENRVNRVTAPF